MSLLIRRMEDTNSRPTTTCAMCSMKARRHGFPGEGGSCAHKQRNSGKVCVSCKAVHVRLKPISSYVMKINEQGAQFKAHHFQRY